MKPKPSTLRYLLCTLFVLLLTEPAVLHAQTLACPASDQTAPAPCCKRWYSPAWNNFADKAPEQCASCAEPRNYLHPSCTVYRTLQSPECNDGQCSTGQGEYLLNWKEGYAVQRNLRHQRPLRFIFDAGSNCWFVVWALEPVIGVEHVQARDAVNLWRIGFDVGTKMVEPPIAASELAMVVQPASKRSQHQLHIHVGRLQPDYRAKLDKLSLKDGLVHETSLDSHHFFIRYLPDMAGKRPLEAHDVFEQVSLMIPGGESMMPLYGVLVARDIANQGSWLMAAKDLTRRVLVLSDTKVCRFRAAVD